MTAAASSGSRSADVTGTGTEAEMRMGAEAEEGEKRFDLSKKILASPVATPLPISSEILPHF
jgi:hypothetical protein